MKKLILLTTTLILFISGAALAQNQNDIDHKLFNCYTVIAGKEATTDGSVIVGHNEDDWNEQMMNMYIVPAQKFKKGERLEIKGNVSLEQPSVTARYFWIEMLAQHYADVYMNEHGVAVVSNRCTSREDREDYTDGGISYTLRRVVAERATSAKEAVKIIGELVEKYGYSSTGRSYSVADKNEAWVVSLVQGRHWVAERVDDNKVMIIPNYYTIDRVDLSDTLKFRGSKDIVEYAVSRGWYNPAIDGEFSFREAYSDVPTLNSGNNRGRKWGGLRLLSSVKYNIDDEFPFEFVPNKKIDVKTLTTVLTDHFEGTKLDMVKSSKNGEPHSRTGSICNAGTQTSTIFHLRDLPKEIGAIMWTAMYSPCRQVYLPWYMGTDYLPANYSGESNPIKALDNHFTIEKGFRDAYPNALYWKFLDYSKYIGTDYVSKMKIYRPKLDELQNEIFENQAALDLKIQQELKHKSAKSSKQAAKQLGAFTREYHNKMMEIIN